MIFDDDKYTEQQKRCIPDVSFELIPIKNLVSNQEYQRPLSEGHIRRALEEFDVYQINPVKVSRQNGINFVFDGQHTIEIVATESGSRETPVWCMIYDDLKYTEEAHIFADQMCSRITWERYLSSRLYERRRSGGQARWGMQKL